VEVTLRREHAIARAIPKEWHVKRLGELAEIRSGGTPSTTEKRFWNGDIPWCTPTDITALDGNKYLNSTARTITAEGLAASVAEVVPAFSVVMTSRATIGECAINTVPLATNQGFKNFVPFENTDVEYLYYLLGTQKQGFLRLCGGSTFLEIGKSQLAGYEVCLPASTAEQRAIATALGDVDALLGTLDRLIAKKHNLKQAAMQQLLTGQTRLPGFSGAWKVQPLNDIVSIPITDGPHLTPTFLRDGVPFLSVNNLVDNKLDFSTVRFISRADHEEFAKKCRPRHGDILFGKAASVGQVALIDTDVELNIWSPLALIRVGPSASARFVVFALQTHNVRRQIALLTNASSQGNIGMSDIGRIAIPLPTVPEQTAIATSLSDMDAQIEALEARRSKTRDLKQAMMQELLTGKTRLVQPEAAHA
jgi:type I restriction enzyme S subunit